MHKPDDVLPTPGWQKAYEEGKNVLKCSCDQNQPLQAKILTEKSEVPSTPRWDQTSSLYEDSFAANPGSNFVDNFGKVKFPAPKADEEAFEDWYAEPIKVAPAEKDVSKSRHDFLMSLRGPKTSEKPPIKVARFDPSQPIKVVRFDPSQNKIVQPGAPPALATKEKPKSASDILRDLQNSGKLPQVNDQLKAQQNQSRRKPKQNQSGQIPNQGGREERGPRETKCRVGWSKTMEAPQEPKVKLKLENQRTRLKKAPAAKEKLPQDVICFECGAEV